MLSNLITRVLGEKIVPLLDITMSSRVSEYNYLANMRYIGDAVVAELGVPGSPTSELEYERDITIVARYLNTLDKQAQDFLMRVTANRYKDREDLVDGSARKMVHKLEYLLGTHLRIAVWVLVGELNDWYDNREDESSQKAKKKVRGKRDTETSD